jgi:hypothetical protein
MPGRGSWLSRRVDNAAAVEAVKRSFARTGVPEPGTVSHDFPDLIVQVKTVKDKVHVEVYRQNEPTKKIGTLEYDANGNHKRTRRR